MSNISNKTLIQYLKEGKIHKFNESRPPTISLFGEDLSGLQLQNVDFAQCDLSKCDFSDSDLSKANFFQTKCNGADFSS